MDKTEYIMEGGVGEKLEVFKDKVTISSFGIFSQKLKGTKTIPYTSIASIEFNVSGSISPGYIQFNLHGVRKSFSFLEATVEHIYYFSGQNELAKEIKNYIEEQVVASQKR
jgi:hypothetical protein